MKKWLFAFILSSSSLAHAAPHILLEDLASPVTTPARYPLLIGTGLTLTFLIFEDQIVDPTQKEISEDKPLGTWSTVGDFSGQFLPNIAYIGGMVIYGLLGNQEGYHHAEVMGIGSLYAGAMTTMLKSIVQEPRPNNGADRQSFPSGHTTVAFAFASVVGAEHGIWWGIPAYSLATLTAVSRMNDNKHYLHDVVGGATIGITYGLGVHYVHAEPGKSAFSFVPYWEGDKKGVLISYKF